MTNRTYYAPQGGLPPQTALLTDRAVFTESYAVTPKGVLRDITVSYFPFWERRGPGCCRGPCRDLPKPSRNTSWM